MLNSIEYPAQAKKALTGGVVVLNFNLDNNGMISKVSVGKSAGNGFDEAAVNALRSYSVSIKDNAGKHSIGRVILCGRKQISPGYQRKDKEKTAMLVNWPSATLSRRL